LAYYVSGNAYRKLNTDKSHISYGYHRHVASLDLTCKTCHSNIKTATKNNYILIEFINLV